jgi:hypothetical protein
VLSRFASNLTLALLAGILATLSLTLTSAATAWVALGIGAATVAITALAFLAPDRGAVQRGLDGPVAVLGGWMVVGSRVIQSAAAVRWMTFAEAVVLTGLTVAGLIAHEALSERGVRRLLAELTAADELRVDRHRSRALDLPRT